MSSNSQSKQEEKEAGIPDLYCPICFHNLKEMSIVGRTQHVNNCLARGNQQPVRLNRDIMIDYIFHCKYADLQEGKSKSTSQGVSSKSTDPDYIVKAAQLSVEQQYEYVLVDFHHTQSDVLLTIAIPYSANE